MKKDKILTFPYIGTKHQRKDHYVSEVVKHPAKMPTYLAKWIIKKYSKPGGYEKVTQEMLDQWDKKVEWSENY